MIELSQRRTQRPDPLSRVFIPCPACGAAIELARDAVETVVIKCPTCGNRFER